MKANFSQTRLYLLNNELHLSKHKSKLRQNSCKLEEL